MRIWGKVSEVSDFRFRKGGKEITLSLNSSISYAADRTVSLPEVDASDTIISRTSTDTLTNKSLSDSTTYFVDEGDNSKKLQLQLSGITTATTRTLTVPDVDTTIVGTDSTQTLTGKTIDADNNTLSNIDDGEIKAAAGIQLSKLASVTASRALVSDGSGVISVSSVTSSEIGQLAGVTVGGNTSGDIVTTDDTQTLSGKTLNILDNALTIQDNADATKQAQFQVSGITTGTTRTFTFPDADTTLVGTALTQTLTNKTIDADNNTISNIANDEIKAGAAVARSKLAAGTADHVVINDGSGNFSSEASLAITRGGTGAATASAGFDALSPLTTAEDILIYRGGTNTRLAVGAEGQVLQVIGGQLAFGTGGGDVTSSANLADNSLIRGDGGAKGVQQTGITITDDDVVEDVAGLTLLDGTSASLTVPSGSTLQHMILTINNTHTYTINGSMVSHLVTVASGGTLVVNGTGYTV